MNRTAAPDYDDLDMAMHRARLDADPAESHGMLCALGCVFPNQDPEHWINEEILQSSAGGAEMETCRKLLWELWRQTGRELASGDYALRLLLPEDDTVLAERSDALALWCDGFLYGLGMAGEGVTERLSADSIEFIDDLAECTHLESGGEYTEEDETAFVEIVEYVRIGVQGIKQELLPQQNVETVQGVRH